MAGGTTTIKVIDADYAQAAHAAAVLKMLDMYAREPIVGGGPLRADVQARLIAEMQVRPHVFSLLAQVDNGFVGLTNCIESFSSFAAAPVLNIHDVFVLPVWRGRGVVQALLSAVERAARHRGCCRITLEVLAGNTPARRVYSRAGFGGANGVDDAGTLFWQRSL